MKAYQRLENSLIDVIKEEQIKLGYRKEQIRFYYPISSLRNFFETDADVETMQQLLKEFPEYTKETLGPVQISNRGERFCFFVPEEGIVYVHAHTKENEFLVKLIELVQRHDISMEQVKQLFLDTKKEVHIEKADHGEFDYLIYFKEDSDPYYYCFKDEGCHIIYHRFLPKDYEDLGW